MSWSKRRNVTASITRTHISLSLSLSYGARTEVTPSRTRSVRTGQAPRCCVKRRVAPIASRNTPVSRSAVEDGEGLFLGAHLEALGHVVSVEDGVLRGVSEALRSHQGNVRVRNGQDERGPEGSSGDGAEGLRVGHGGQGPAASQSRETNGYIPRLGACRVRPTGMYLDWEPVA
eukprot:1192026-Prorocentrum_minimum.AAC.4